MLDKKPSEVLQAVRDSIGYKTTVRKNGQAVTLHYTTFPTVDIVPVYYVHNGDNKPWYYCVPDANTETWIDSNPKNHSTAILDKATKCGDNFRKIIKMAKHWNKSHSDYLQSYHIEVMATKIFDSDLSDTPWHTMKFFDEARTLLREPMWHERGYVDSYLSAADRAEVIKRLQTAYDYSLIAWSSGLGINGNTQTAIENWRRVFGDKFPTYG